MALEKGQVLKKIYTCSRCKSHIRIAPEEIDASSGKVKSWQQYNEDGTQHDCKKHKKEQEEAAAGPQNNTIEELKSLRQLLVVATRRIDALLEAKS